VKATSSNIQFKTLFAISCLGWLIFILSVLCAIKIEDPQFFALFWLLIDGMLLISGAYLVLRKCNSRLNAFQVSFNPYIIGSITWIVWALAIWILRTMGLDIKFPV